MALADGDKVGVRGVALEEHHVDEGDEQVGRAVFGPVGRQING